MSPYPLFLAMRASWIQSQPQKVISTEIPFLFLSAVYKLPSKTEYSSERDRKELLLATALSLNQLLPTVKAFQGDSHFAMSHPFVYCCSLTSGSKYCCLFLAWSRMSLLLQGWVFRVYSMEKHPSFWHLQFQNRQKRPKGSMSLSFLGLLVSLSNFSGSFDSLVAG